VPRPLTERRRRKGFESGSGQTRLRFGQQGHDGCPAVAGVGHELEADSTAKDHRLEPDRVAEGFKLLAGGSVGDHRQQGGPAEAQEARIFQPEREKRS